MEKIKLGIVGLGQRGSGMLETFLAFDKLDVVAICDVYEDRVETIANKIKEKRNFDVAKYTDFEAFIKDKEINAIYIASSWEAHINQAIRCMEEKIPCGMEVGGAFNLKDCWRLVNTYEKTKTPFMIMENCCYDKFELLSLSLARKNMLGTIVYAHGAYSHDLRDEITSGNIKRHYRLRNYISRNCENYPTHDFGPIAKILNLNAGNRVISVSSVASKSVGLHEFANSEKCQDKTLKNQEFKQGDVISTIIRCENGETVTLTLNTTLPTHYSREFELKGSKGYVVQESNMVMIDGEYEEIWQPVKTIEKYINNAKNYDKYLPEYWPNITKEQENLGHGGMDYFMVQDFIDRLLNNKIMPLDVYDAALWYAITPLSAKSIKQGGKPQKMPDFTRGKYKIRKQIDVHEFDI